MISNTSEIIKQFARVGRIFSRPIIKNRYPSHFNLESDYKGNVIIEK